MPASKRQVFLIRWVIFLMAFATDLAAAHPGQSSGTLTNLFSISTVSVRGKTISPNSDGLVNLGVSPENIYFHFGPSTNLGRSPIRLRYILEGYEKNWHEDGGSMFIGFRFYNRFNEPISQPYFSVSGQSSGWNGSLTNSALTHRHEILIVPSNASRMSVIISSAGPPATEGIYVVANLVVSKKHKSTEAQTEVIIGSPFNYQTNIENQLESHGWMRDGDHANMAKTVWIGSDSSIEAFAILDDDPISHAEWRLRPENSPTVSPGDSIIADWDEMYSFGVEDTRTAAYGSLPPGAYTFRIQELDLFGVPTGAGTALRIIVPQPFWRTIWFWSGVSLIVIFGVFGLGRYLTWQRIKKEMSQLKNQHELERERLRIAHDIHDDLGARVTQISMVSALAERNSSFPDPARTEFGKVTLMARELVSALYETVWAVNPENDNLEALGNYLCQMISRLCEQTQFRCRLYVSDLPKNVQISSQVRHNLSMAVKEAVHNIIKHANATQVEIRIDYSDDLLNLSVVDDGEGFDTSKPNRGNGLINMKHRCDSIGGDCHVLSECSKGTTIRMTLNVKSAILRKATI